MRSPTSRGLVTSGMASTAEPSHQPPVTGAVLDSRLDLDSVHSAESLQFLLEQNQRVDLLREGASHGAPDHLAHADPDRLQDPGQIQLGDGAREFHEELHDRVLDPYAHRWD